MNNNDEFELLILDDTAEKIEAILKSLLKNSALETNTAVSIFHGAICRVVGLPFCGVEQSKQDEALKHLKGLFDKMHRLVETSLKQTWEV